MNCIMLVIDALDYTRVQESRYDLLPFLHRQEIKACYTTNMYSEAPYTEAATMALYGGQRTLDNHGYLKRYKELPKVIFESFKENGFDVFFNALQPQCYPSSLRRGINNIYYDRAYDQDVLWSYRLCHYSDLQKNNSLDDNDYLLLSEILEDNFTEWIRFLNDYIVGDSSTELIAGLNKDYDFDEALKAVVAEYNKFKENRIDYIKELLNKGKSHSFFKTPYYKQINHGISDKSRSMIDKRCKKLFFEIRLRNFFDNLFYNKDVYLQAGAAIKSFVRDREFDEFLNSMYLVKNTLIPVHLADRYGKNGPILKGQPSFNTLSRHLLDWIDTRERATPFFACLHVDDIHFPEVFFTYDSDDLNVVMSDLNIAESYLKKRKHGEIGTIVHDLSLLFADHQCEILYNEIKNRNLDNDTVFIVTADHGFSFSGNPIREKFVNTYYLENFKIPFYAFGPGISKQQIDSLQSSVSIPQTICELMGLKSEDSFFPSVFNSNNEVCFIEYCGGGCPDLRRREVMLAAFDFSKMVAYKSSLNVCFSKENIVEVYDLHKDPKQRRNLVNEYDYKDYSLLIDAIKKRFNEIKAENI